MAGRDDIPDGEGDMGDEAAMVKGADEAFAELDRAI